MGYPFDVESSHWKCFTSAVTFKDCLVNMVMDYIADCEELAGVSRNICGASKGENKWHPQFPAKGTL